MGYLQNVETATTIELAGSLTLKELVAKLKSTPNDKSVTIEFPLQVGKLLSGKFKQLLDEIYMVEDVELTYKLKKGILQDIFNVTVGGINSEVKKAVLRVLRAVQQHKLG